MTTRISGSVTLKSATIFSPLVQTVVGTISDSDERDTAADFAVTISWGDGAESAATIVGLGNGLFDVEGTHTYIEMLNPATLSLAIDGPNLGTLTASGSISVTDNLTPNVININSPVDQSFNGIVAVFDDSIPNDTSNIADFSATINWGDGSETTGAIVAPGNGTLEVLRSHTYNSGGRNSSR